MVRPRRHGAMSAFRQSASVIRKLAKHGVDALRPQKVEAAAGHNPWRRPLVSKRQAADARKQAIRAGT